MSESEFRQVAAVASSLLSAYCASQEFQDLLTGALQWGDLLAPLPPSLPPRDFSALAGRKNRRGTAFASLNKRKTATAARAAPGVSAPEPSVPGWRPADAEAVEAPEDAGGLYMCPGCDGVFQCYCNEDHADARSYASQDGCEDCGRNPCRCCSGCYPGCFGCDPDFNPADPWGDGAPEEHRGWYPDDWSDDE